MPLSTDLGREEKDTASPALQVHQRARNGKPPKMAPTPPRSAALTVQTGKVTQVLFKVTLSLEFAAARTLSLGLKGNGVEALGSHPGARCRVGER